MGFRVSLVLCFVFLVGCRQPANAVSDKVAQCPGRCVGESDECTSILNETECKKGFRCCVDHFEKDPTIGYDWDSSEPDRIARADDYVSTMPDDESERVARNDEYEYLSSMPDGYSDEMNAESDSDADEQYYTNVYGDHSLQRSGDSNDECPGACVPEPYSQYCEFVVDADLCDPEMSCCVTENIIRELNGEEYKADDTELIEERSDSAEVCPGTCVHPSQTIFCDKAYLGYGCSFNKRCCIKRAPGNVEATPMFAECTGQCLTLNMRQYCIPPNELVGPTTCAPGTTCCTKMRDHSRNAASYPVLDYQQNIPGSPVLGHLAMDDGGNIFKVGLNGQITPLRKISVADHSRYAYSKVTEFERANGVVVIYSDSNGILYQQFYERAQKPPMFRQPINQFESQASEHAINFKTTTEAPNVETEEPESLDDIVIPEDDDEPPQTLQRPSVKNSNPSTPQCPGSCMSYFLRFTCFRGHAIYDGFTCPGRQVCCARLEDIEDHENYLKSLSPYFNSSPVSKDKSLPRCGIKGRRETPRIMGGKEALPGEWCWQVAVINAHNQYMCGGALIDNSWVLTAAHCVAGSTKENKSLYVRAGVTDLRSPEDNSHGQTIKVLSTFVHHNFKHQNLDNDIALLRLQKPFDLGANVCVICLPTTGQMPKVNSKCSVTGYGFVSDNQMSLKIHEAQVPIVDDMDCMTNVTEALSHPFILPGSSFCAGGFGQQDACQGDAGGPLACENNGFYELAGVVSWGLGCTRSDVPSIYVRIPAFMGWINQIISSSSFLMSLN